MTLPKVKPCPECGNIYVELYAYENGWQHVECDECHYLGPGGGSQLTAVRAHNAIAAATGTAKTAKLAECEASQSGGEAASPKAQAPSEHERRGS